MNFINSLATAAANSRAMRNGGFRIAGHPVFYKINSRAVGGCGAYGSRPANRPPRARHPRGMRRRPPREKRTGHMRCVPRRPRFRRRRHSARPTAGPAAAHPAVSGEKIPFFFIRTSARRLLSRCWGGRPFF